MRMARVLVMLAAAVVITSFFFPYMKTTDLGMEQLEESVQNKPIQSVGMLAEEYKELSLFEYVKIYKEGSEEIFNDELHAVIYPVLWWSTVGIAALIILMALVNLPILSIIFSALLAGVVYMIRWDFVDRGIMPSRFFQWGPSYFVLNVCSVIVLICSIWMLIDKIRDKKARKI